MRAIRQPMLHGIVVNVINVRLQIAIVSDFMFPEMSLPHAAPAMANSRSRPVLFHAAPSQKFVTELRFDRCDARRVVGIAGRQRQKKMPVVRQQHNRVNLKGPTNTTLVNRLPKKSAR